MPPVAHIWTNGWILLLFVGFVALIAGVSYWRARKMRLPVAAELRKTEEALHRSEEQYRVIAEYTADKIWVMDMDLTFTYVNPAVETLFGFAPSEIIGKSLAEMCPPKELEALRAIVEERIVAGPNDASAQFESLVYNKSGDLVPVEIHGTVIFGQSGQPVALEGVTRDVSERKRQELRMMHIQQVLRAVRDVNQLIVHEKDLQSLLRRACGILTSARGYQAAWIALLAGEHGPPMAAESGIGAKFESFHQRLKEERWPKCFQKALEVDHCIVVHPASIDCDDCPLACASQNSAALASAIRHDERAYGVIVVILPSELAHDSEEQALFEELAYDIGYATASIHTERQREQAEEELERSNEVLSQLLEVARELTTAPDTQQVVDIVRQNARSLSKADGVTVVLRDGDECHYVEEDALEPLWKGRRFPMDECISGWVMTHGEAVAIEDIQADARIPQDAYRDTFVKSLAMAPIRAQAPIGAIGAYWKESHAANETEKALLAALANMTSSVFEAIDSRRALLRSEQTLRALFESASDGVLVVNVEDGRILMFNRAIREMLGYADEEFASLSIAELASPASRDELVASFSPRGNDSSGAISRIELRQKDGGALMVDVSVSPFQIDDRPCVAGIVRDISTRLSLEEQLRQAQKMEAIGQLAGGVAHDYNNMIMGISNYAELCQKRVVEDPETREWLDEIASLAKRSAGLTRQLLAFARQQTITPKVLDLNDTVAAMLKMLRSLIGEDINLVWKPGADLWDLHMDPGQIDQILANLCVNARDAIGGNGQVVIATENKHIDQSYCAKRRDLSPGDYVVLTVSDDGCGMDHATVERAFEPFFTTKPVGEGTGLGLATVYGIVKQNNGMVNLYSEPGQGATFRIYLPRHEKPATEQPEEEPQDEPAGGSETILLVEDEPGVRIPAQIFLEDFAYRVLAAEGPKQALKLAEEHPGEIDLLITDVVMPNMNGRELADKLQAQFPSMRCLYISGYTADIIAHRGVLDDGVDLLNKPFGFKELAHKVREVLDRQPA